MRKRMAIIGAVVLVVGVVLFFGISEEILATSTVGQHLVKSGNGEWKSTELNVTGGGEITLISNSSSIGLIPASDISKVTSSNLENYAIRSSNGTNISAYSVTVYAPPAGSYYFVAFSSSNPTVTYTVMNSAGLIVVYGLLEMAGVAMGIAGLIVLIIGAILKPKHQKEDDDPLGIYKR